MAYYNSKVDQGNRQKTRVAQDIVNDWNSLAKSKALAEMRTMLQNLLQNHGAYLPAQMKSQVEGILSGLK